LINENPLELLILKGSNIGIGTTSPQVTLDTNRKDAYKLPSGVSSDRPTGVQGYIRYNTESQQFEGFGAGNQWGSLGGVKSVAGDTYILAEYSAGNDDKGLHFYTSNIEQMILTSNGNLGIGTTLPRQRLDVNNGNAIVSGKIGIGTVSPQYNLHTEGTAGLLGGSKIVIQNGQDGGSSRGIYYWLSSDTNWGTYLSQSGATKSLADNTATAGAGFTSWAIRNRAGSSLGTAGFVWENNEEQLLASIRSSDGLSYFAGNTGIGSSSPAFKLDVAGDAHISGPVGIGTTNKTNYKLTISPNVYVSASNTWAAIHYENELTELEVGINHNTTESGSEPGYAYFWNYYDYGFQFATNSIECVRIDNKGNVGIGTKSPVVALEVWSSNAILLPKGTSASRPTGVQGYIRYNTESQQFEGFGAGNQWGSLGGVKSVAGDTYILAEYTAGNDDKALHFYTNGSEQMILNSFGNLGIGTLTPLRPLQVEEGALFMNGNVGIGTTIPNYTLDIQGDLNVSQIFTNSLSLSNLTVTGSYFIQNDSQYIRNTLQINPLRITQQVQNSSTSNFTGILTGLYKAEPQNTEVYVNGYKMAYSTASNKDYDVTYSLNNVTNQSTFSVTLEETPAYGDIVDIIVWPQYLDPNGMLQPGYVLQNINYSYWNKSAYDSNLYYTTGNIGIGTETPIYPLDVPTNAYIQTLFGSNVYIEKYISTGAKIGINTTLPYTSLDIRTTDAILLPRGTTLERPSGIRGLMRYNTDTSQFEGLGAADQWGSLGGVKSTDQQTYISAELTAGANDGNLRFYNQNNLSMIITPGGNVGIGTESSIVSLEIWSSNAILLPKGTNSSRPTGVQGYIRYNTESQQFEGFGAGNQWGSLGGVKSVAGDTYILAEYSAGNDDKSLHFYTSNIEQMILNSYGNLGIGTTIPREKLDVIGDTIISGNVGIGLTTPTELLDVNGTIQTSNIRILGRITFGPDDQINNDIQIAPIRKIFYTESEFQNQFVLTKPGIYGGYASNAQVFVGQNLLSYYNSNINDYTLSIDYNSSSNTTYTITLTEPVEYASVVDITIWPTILPSSLPQGNVKQTIIQNIIWTENNGNTYYNSGNVGIGTTQPIDRFHVVGDSKFTGAILPSACNIYNLGSSNLRWKDLYLSGNTINLGETLISVNEEHGGLLIHNNNTGLVNMSVNTMISSNMQLVNGYITGNIGIGTEYTNSPLHIHINNSILQLPSPNITSFPPSSITSLTQTLNGQNYGNGAYIITESYYDPVRETWRAFDKYKTGDQWWGSRINAYASSGGVYLHNSNTSIINNAPIAGEWIQIQLPVNITPTSYIISPRQDSQYALERRNPRSWSFLGSTNGNTWYLLDRVSNKYWGTNDDHTRNIYNANSYSHYRFIVEAVGNSNTTDNTQAAVCELVINGFETTNNTVSSLITVSSSTGEQIMTLSNIGRINGNTSNTSQALLNVNGNAIVMGNIGIGTTIPQAHLDINGTTKANIIHASADILIGDDLSAAYRCSPVISQENIYTWWGDNPVVNTVGVQNEPWFYKTRPDSTTFQRITQVGTAALGTASLWNTQYIMQVTNTDLDNQGNITTPTNYICLSLPVKYINDKTFSHAVFLKFISSDRWNQCCVYVTNQQKTSFTRLQSKVNSYNDSTTVLPYISWIGPNGESAAQQRYHEWQMFSIPEYIVKQYAYDEPGDDKSKYGKNINICFIRGINDGGLYLSGIAMRVNPYGLTFHSALELYWATNGGSASAWYGIWNNENLNQWTANTNYVNIRIPICPPKDPATNRFPDFYMVYVAHLETFDDKNRVYLYNPVNGNSQYLGMWSKNIRGRYGTRLIDEFRYAMGVIVPSPDPQYIVYVGGRPYLNIRYDLTQWGAGHNSHCRGIFTEVIHPEGNASTNNLIYSPIPIQYN